MRHGSMAALIVLAGLTLGMPGTGVSADDQQDKQKPKAEAQTPQAAATVTSMPLYKPPKRGAPGGRVGGGTRGPGDDLPSLSVLAPDHVGLTTQEQPDLYWFLSKPTTYPIELAIIHSQGVQPGKTLIEVRIPTPARAGVQCIRLADYGVRLAPGVQYQWFVALVFKPDRRSNDVIAGGFIERIGPPEAVRAKLTQAGKANAAYIYAETGIWYDAIGVLSDMIDAAPKDAGPRNQRAALLQQVGLPDVAKYELAAGRE